MKKSMRMVSVIMSAVMAMSAMSALAAGASALEVNQHYYIIDAMHSNSQVSFFITTTGLNSKIKSFSITLDYEFTVTPGEDSAVVREVMAAHPEAIVSQQDSTGFLLVKIHEKRTFSENTGANKLSFNIPEFTDMNNLKIRLDYNSKTLGEREIGKFDFASLNLNDLTDCNDISIYLDHDSFSSIVTGDIFVNGNWVFTRKR